MIRLSMSTSTARRTAGSLSIRPIVVAPDPCLRAVAAPVEKFDDDLRQLLDDMLETMYDAPGIGLAATQVNVHQRILVIDVSEEHKEPRVFINPEVEVLDPELGEYDEGCLSVPGFYETVNRPRRIRVTALDREVADHRILNLREQLRVGHDAPVVHDAELERVRGVDQAL